MKLKIILLIGILFYSFPILCLTVHENNIYSEYLIEKYRKPKLAAKKTESVFVRHDWERLKKLYEMNEGDFKFSIKKESLAIILIFACYFFYLTVYL